MDNLTTGDGIPGLGIPGVIEKTKNYQTLKRDYPDSYARMTARAHSAWCDDCHGIGWTAYGDDVTRCLKCGELDASHQA